MANSTDLKKESWLTVCTQDKHKQEGGEEAELTKMTESTTQSAMWRNGKKYFFPSILPDETILHWTSTADNAWF